jgi:hypothetical protein
MSVEGHQPVGHEPTGHTPTAESGPTANIFIKRVALTVLGVASLYRIVLPERMTQRVQYACSDEGDAQVAPASARYRIDCATTGRQVRGWTDIPDVAASGFITLSPDDTAVVDPANNSAERRIVHVEASYGGQAAARNRIEFLVERMTGLR